MTALATRSPYLRNRLLQAAEGLRSDAETARLNLAEADQDVAAARALLAEAEAHRDRAAAEVDSIDRGITWLEREAAKLTAEPADDPAAKLRATGLMREEPIPAAELPGMWEEADFLGGQTDMDEPPCDCPPGTCKADPFPDDDLVPPGAPVKDSRAEIAPHLPATPPTPHEPAGVVVATHGPTTTTPLDPAVTAPDAGLAHPVPNPAVLPPADPTGTARHAKPADRPGLLARLTGGHRIVGDDQNGDA